MSSRMIRQPNIRPKFDLSLSSKTNTISTQRSPFTAPITFTSTPISIATPTTAPVLSAQSEYILKVDANEILPNLYLGDWSVGCCPKFITENNIKLIINCAHDCCIPEFITTQQLSLCYMYHPIKDNADEPIDNLFESCTEQIRATLLRGEGVVVHCMKGISRSATIILAYLIKFGLVLDTVMPMTYEDAFNYVYDKRKICPNLGFCMSLMEFSEKVTEIKQNYFKIDM